MESKEFSYKGITVNGFFALLLVLVLLGVSVWLFTMADAVPGIAPPGALLMVILCVCLNGMAALSEAPEAGAPETVALEAQQAEVVEAAQGEEKPEAEESWLDSTGKGFRRRVNGEEVPAK